MPSGGGVSFSLRLRGRTRRLQNLLAVTGNGKLVYGPPCPIVYRTYTTSEQVSLLHYELSTAHQYDVYVDNPPGTYAPLDYEPQDLTPFELYRWRQLNPRYIVKIHGSTDEPSAVFDWHKTRSAYVDKYGITREEDGSSSVNVLSNDGAITTVYTSMSSIEATYTEELSVIMKKYMERQ